MILSRTSRPSNYSLFHRASSAWKLCNSTSSPSPVCGCFARQTVESHDADAMGFTRRLHSLRGLESATGDGSAVLKFDRHPYIDTLQTAVSVDRQFSRIPQLTLGHSLGAYPAPHHPVPGAPILQHVGFCFCRTPPPTRCVGSPLPKKHPRPWERGTSTTPARKVRVLGDPGTRVASRKSVREQSGQIQPGELR